MLLGLSLFFLRAFPCQTGGRRGGGRRGGGGVLRLWSGPVRKFVSVIRVTAKRFFLPPRTEIKSGSLEVFTTLSLDSPCPSPCPSPSPSLFPVKAVNIEDVNVLIPDHVADPVVKTSESTAEGQGFDSRLGSTRDFFLKLLQRELVISV